MTDLMWGLRRMYGVVLVVGSSAAEDVDLRLSASRSDLILLSKSEKGAITESIEEIIRDLMDAQAPVLGIVE